ncbi:MAG TPA: hypothetical protein PKM73_03315 [Verrucomicrobiota bacterium]|nr:hypothetical protein [Verrucomicrobiota bacterium]HNU50386.1 hypothetical protein [Verrucomicrobiota bacterium]
MNVTLAIVLAAALSASAASVCAGAFSWKDDADDDDYSLGQYIGVNAGNGFDAWILLEKGSTADGASYLAGQPFHPEQPAIEGASSWGMNGTQMVGRGLEQPVPVGTWTFLAAHNVANIFDSGFSGFNLRSLKTSSDGLWLFTESELLRFGFNDDPYTGEQGICYSLDPDSGYVYLGGRDWIGTTLEYSVSWQPSGGVTQYSLSVKNLDTGETLEETIFATSAHPPVEMLGTAIFGANNAETITFDTYWVVPEPAAAVPVLAVVCLAAALCRRLRFVRVRLRR